MKECRGCRISSKSTFCCFKLAQSQKKCPCIECLVKVVCKKECLKRLQSRADIMKGKTVGEFIKIHSKEYTVLNRILEIK